VESAQKAVRLEPDSTDALWQLASIQIRRGHWDSVGSTVTALWRMRPDDPDVRHYLEIVRRAKAADTATAAAEGHT